MRNKSIGRWLLVAGAVAIIALLYHRTRSASRSPIEPRASTASGVAQAPSVVDRGQLDQVIRALEAQVGEKAAAQFEQHWWQLRAFGPKASQGTRDKVRSALSEPPAFGELGSEPRIALGAALVEAGSKFSELGLALPEALPQESDGRALAWRIDLLGLLTLSRHEPNPSQALGRHFQYALTLLLRSATMDAEGSLHLAAALFRAAPLVVGPQLEPMVRRVFGKLRYAKGSEALLGVKLEAYGAYVLSAARSDAVKDELVTLTQQVLGLAQTTISAAPSSEAEAVPLLRGLRVARAALQTFDKPTQPQAG